MGCWAQLKLAWKHKKAGFILPRARLTNPKHRSKYGPGESRGHFNQKVREFA